MGDGQRTLPPPSLRQQLRLPIMQHQDNIIAAVPRKVYSNAHAYHIHSITVNSDQETYISADDLRINLWNLNISDQSFSALFLSARFPSLSSISPPMQTSWISSQLTWRSSPKSSRPPSSIRPNATFSCIPARKVISSLRICGTLRYATGMRNVRHARAI
jgi:serine/threonine-protein phosphatase 2A regulatory subunit B